MLGQSGDPALINRRRPMSGCSRSTSNTSTSRQHRPLSRDEDHCCGQLVTYLPSYLVVLEIKSNSYLCVPAPSNTNAVSLACSHFQHEFVGRIAAATAQATPLAYPTEDRDSSTSHSLSISTVLDFLGHTAVQKALRLQLWLYKQL